MVFQSLTHSSYCRPNNSLLQARQHRAHGEEEEGAEMALVREAASTGAVISRCRLVIWSSSRRTSTAEWPRPWSCTCKG